MTHIHVDTLNANVKLFASERGTTIVGPAKGCGNFKSECSSSFSVGTVIADVATANAHIPSSTEW